MRARIASYAAAAFLTAALVPGCADDVPAADGDGSTSGSTTDSMTTMTTMPPTTMTTVSMEESSSGGDDDDDASSSDGADDTAGTTQGDDDDDETSTGGDDDDDTSTGDDDDDDTTGGTDTGGSDTGGTDTGDTGTTGGDPCGNGVIDRGEQCDGASLDGMSCASLGFESGALACAGDCTYDTTGCDPFPNDCCEPGEGPGCDDPDCTATVCSVDPFCCDAEWDGICSAEAQGVCEVCGGGGGDCCTEVTPDGCSDAACVNIICGEAGIDPDCCVSGWNAGCVALAEENCGVCLPPGTCGNETIDSVDEECDGLDLGGQTCAGLGFDRGTLSCGGTCAFDSSGCVDFEGGCCAPNDTPGCTDDACRSSVCAVEPACCDFEWFDLCANIADVFCDVCNTPDICGNGDLEGDEACDGDDFAGMTCDDFGFSGGTLSCDESCEIETDSCFDFSGPCCAPNPTPGCSDGECTTTVCEVVDPFCCEVEWDPFCAEIATFECDLCTTPDVCGNGMVDGKDELCDGLDVGMADCMSEGFDGGTLLCNETCDGLDTSACIDFDGECCVGNPTPGCEDETCSAQVCAFDNFCCEIEWDPMCAAIADGVCEACGVRPGTCGNFIVDDVDEQCDGPDLQDMTCADFMFDGGFLGCDPGCEFDTGGCFNYSGDCCAATGSPGCEDSECTATVCALEPFCCDIEWDFICADLANESCAVCNFDGDCCDPAGNGTPGCIDLGCTDAVCAASPECCDSEWDAACAATAAGVCAVCGPPLGEGDCCSDNGTPGCDTSLQCQFNVCSDTASCCDTAWDMSCDVLADTLCGGLCVQQEPCANEDLGTGSLGVMGSTIGEADVFEGTCGAEEGADYVFEYTASASGLHTFDTFGSVYDTVLYAVSDCASGDVIACNDDTFDLQSQIILNLVDGETVLIVVAGFGGDEGNFQLTVDAP